MPEKLLKLIEKYRLPVNGWRELPPEHGGGYELLAGIERYWFNGHAIYVRKGGVEFWLM